MPTTTTTTNTTLPGPGLPNTTGGPDTPLDPTPITPTTSTASQGVLASNIVAPTATASNYNAAQTTVNEPKDTTAGQLQGILATNSPLLQQAKAAALGEMNNRGLLNSSMAVGAGYDAMVKNALPIASQDATTNFNANMANTQATNTANQFNAGVNTDVSKTNATLNQQAQAINQDQADKMSLANAQINTQNAQFNAAQTNDVLKANMDAQSKTQLANIEANYKALMQTSAGASDLYKQVVTNMTNILGSKDMNADAKQAAIQNQMQMLRSGLAIQGDIVSLDLAGTLDFSGLTGSGTNPGGAAGVAPNTQQVINSQNQQITDLTTKVNQLAAQLAAAPAPTYDYGGYSGGY
jgi:glycine cleavage system H lipoate-binding protein